MHYYNFTSAMFANYVIFETMSVFWKKVIIYHKLLDGRWQRGLKYLYRYQDRTSKTCMTGTDPLEQDTVVCKQSITPVITTFRIEYHKTDSSVRLTGVYIYAAGRYLNLQLLIGSHKVFSAHDLPCRNIFCSQSNLYITIFLAHILDEFETPEFVNDYGFFRVAY